MKITKARLKQIIKEELEVTLTNEEAGEMFGEAVGTQLEEQELNEDMDTLMQNLTPENISLMVQALLQIGYTFAAPMLAALLARLGYEAGATAMAQDALKRKDKNWLMNFFEDELTGYERHKRPAPKGPTPGTEINWSTAPEQPALKDIPWGPPKNR